ncbi:MAG: hypothetical protein U1F27_03015 [Turneriella sp.]
MPRDLIAGILALATLPREKYDGPVNLGNPGEFTIKELVGVLEELTGKNSKRRTIRCCVRRPQDAATSDRPGRTAAWLETQSRFERRISAHVQIILKPKSGQGLNISEDSG